MNLVAVTDQATVFQASWQELLPQLGPKSVDVCLTDPPYTEHVHKNIRSCTTHMGPVKVREWEPGFDALTDYEHVPALLNVAKRWVLCFCALESFGEYRQAASGDRKAGGKYVRSWVWRKGNAAPQLSGDRPANSCEGISVMHDNTAGRMQWNGGGSHAYWDAAPTPGAAFPDEGFIDNAVFATRDRGTKVHPAQKPMALCRHLVMKFSNPGETILDPFCGGGNMVMAALELGRKVIACDIEEQWALETARRVQCVS